MKKNTAVFLCAINGILMILYPLIGGLLFSEQLILVGISEYISMVG